ncbi:MAG: glycosyltransferase family 39 protein [Cyclobacteriaceae bacterium]|nr:glycosyltransferase family 39 protein [Cyclobacteriaceae bacterium]
MGKNKKIKKGEPEIASTTTLRNTAKEKPAGWFENVIYIIILSILFLSVYGYTFDEKLDLNGDNAYYYVLGKAISQGEGYVNIASITRGPNNHFPPGYPFILSLFMHFSDSTTFLKTLNGLFLLISLILLYELFKRISGNQKIAFITVFFLALNSHLLQYGTMLMSEVSFILVSYLCLLLVDRSEFNNDFLKRPYFYLILISLVASYYIRATGLALFGGVFLYLLIHKKWKVSVALTAGFIAFALPWIIRGQKLGGSAYLKPLVMVNPYRPELGNADFTGYIARFFANAGRYITREIPNSAFPFIQVDYVAEISMVEWLLGFILLAISFYGFYRMWRRGLMFILYLAATSGILLLWPEVWRGVRFVLPVMPIILFSILTGTYYLADLVLSSLKIKFNIILIVVFGLAFIDPVKALHQKAISPYPLSWQNYFKVAAWFKSENIEDVVVVCRKPMLFHLKSGTFTAPYIYSKDGEEMIADLKAKKTDYIVLDNLGYRQTYEYLYPVIRNNPDIFPLVFSLQNPDTYLLKFAPEN